MTLCVRFRLQVHVADRRRVWGGGVKDSQMLVAARGRSRWQPAHAFRCVRSVLGGHALCVRAALNAVRVPAASAALAQHVARHPTLEYLSVNNCFLGDGAVRALCDSLRAVSGVACER